MAMQLSIAVLLSVALLLNIAMQLSVAVLMSVAVFVLAGAAVVVAMWWVLLQLKQKMDQKVTITKPTQVNEHKASYCLVGLTYRNTWKLKDLV